MPNGTVTATLEVSPPTAEVAIIKLPPPGGRAQVRARRPLPGDPGRYNEEFVAGSDYVILARAPGWVTRRHLYTAVDAQAPHAVLEIKLEPMTPAASVFVACRHRHDLAPGGGPGARCNRCLAQAELALEEYLATKVKGVTRLSSGQLRHFEEALVAWVAGKKVGRATAEDMVERVAQGPDLLIELACTANDDDDGVQTAALQAEIHLPIWDDIRSATEQVKIRSSDHGGARPPEMEADEALDLDDASVRLARLIGYKLNRICPAQVIPHDLPPDFLAVLVHVGRHEADGYPVYLEIEPGDCNERAGFLETVSETVSLANLQRDAAAIAQRKADDRFLADFGAALYGWIASVLGAKLSKAWESAQDARKNLRLRLCLDDRELAALPWEYLLIPWLGTNSIPRAGHVGLRVDFVLSRYVVDGQRSSQEQSPPRALVIVPCVTPDDSGEESAPTCTSEAARHLAPKEILRSLKDLSKTYASRPDDIHHIRPTVRNGSNATWNAVVEELQRDKTLNIYHFVGHGGNTGTPKVFALYGSTEDHKKLVPSNKTADDMVELLQNHNFRLVILQSCSSTQADVELGIGLALAKFVPAVVAMQHDIGIDAANRFAKAFYCGLALGHAVDVAAAEGRHAIAAATTDDRDWGTPVIFMNGPDLFEKPALFRRTIPTP